MSKQFRLGVTLFTLFLGGCKELRAPIPPPAAAPAEATRASERVLDDFEQAELWTATASDDVKAAREAVEGSEGKALALHFDFQGHGGYASLKRALSLTLPEHYEISFDLRGDAPRNDFQFKLADASGENVWWFRRADYQFSHEFRRITVKKRQIEFAWGPTKQRELTRAASLEFVVYAGSEGGSGTIAIDNLRIRELPAPPPLPRPIASASSAVAGGEAERASDGSRETAWESAPERGKEEWLALDLGVQREFGGLVLRWSERAPATDYDVELSRDGSHFELVRSVRGGDGGSDALLLPESEARFVRLALRDGPADRYALSELEIREIAFGASPNAFVSALAREAPRGHYPRGFHGEQPYWTLVGGDGIEQSGLFSEDGALEVGAGGFSIEPFVIVDGALTSWADARIDHRLEERALPAPSSRWHHPAYELEVSAFQAASESPELWARYVLKNTRAKAARIELVLAVRPYQVNPPTQFLNIAGGVSPIRELAWDGRALAVNGRSRVLPLKLPDHVGLATFDGGGFPEANAPKGGRAAQSVRDDTGFASAALVYELDLKPGQSVALGVHAPLGAAGEPVVARSLADLERARARTLASWREQQGRISLRVPPAGQRVVDSVRSALAHIQMSRAGPVLRPGTRSYSRSWIRDGAMMSEALLRLGHEQTARAYLEWFAPYQFENGKVPCCVDRRGADPVVENDSAGEFIFLVAEVHRYTRDRALLERMWPHVAAAARYMDELRRSQRSDENRQPERRAYYGLMPPSISHEGYSDKPAYSYWDNFWALLGYEDAVEIARELGRTREQAELEASRDEFRGDVMASLRESAAKHGVNYLPGAADRGDFDATSTTIALSPGRAQADLPPAQLAATFERYYQEFVARRDGAREWSDYTPYELRVVATFVRLGMRERAHELLSFFFGDQRPTGWNQWAEVVGRDPREPRFIGDMPHAWIASDYIRSALDLFAYARVQKQKLVLAAGIPSDWFEQTGVTVERLRTPYGLLHYTARRRGASVVFELKSPAPPGGFAIPWPWEGEPGRATIDGRPATWEGRELLVAKAPARVVLERP